MVRVNLNSDLSSYVLINLFKDAMAKIGRGNVAVDRMDYHAGKGLTFTDTKGVVWNLEVGAKVVIPKCYKSLVPKDKDAKQFCPECSRGTIDGLCVVCEYLKSV